LTGFQPKNNSAENSYERELNKKPRTMKIIKHLYNSKKIISKGCSTLVLLLFSVLYSYSQVQLNDQIITKEGDTIECKITEIKQNWIYYDYRTKKSFKNDYINIDDIKSYLYQGVLTIPKEYKLWGRLDAIGSKPDNVPVDKDQFALDISTEPKDWHLGFLTFKNSPDTLFGWVKEDRWKGSRFEKIVFKKRMEQPFETFYKDSLRSYQWGKQYFRYFRTSDFSKLIIRGEVDLYLGHVMVSAPPPGGYRPIDCLVLKKGNEPAVFIRIDASHSKIKELIMPLVEDNTEVLSKINNVNFSYKDIENIIAEYNKAKLLK
jgi:hypothetical protein